MSTPALAPCPLTPLELARLRAVLSCRTYRVAAEQMGCGEDAVRVMMRKVRIKLGVTSTAAAAVFAVERGWLPVHLRPPQTLLRAPTTTEHYCPLTLGELRALRVVARTGVMKLAAARLGCHYQTVKNTIWHANTKLGTNSTVQSVTYAIERGWIRNVTIDLETKWYAHGGGMEGAGE